MLPILFSAPQVPELPEILEMMKVLKISEILETPELFVAATSWLLLVKRFSSPSTILTAEMLAMSAL